MNQLPRNRAADGSRRSQWPWLLGVIPVAALAALGWTMWRPPVEAPQPSPPDVVPEADEPAVPGADASPPPTAPPAVEHPLDPALLIAREGLTRLRRDVRDFTATLVKRERHGGKLLEEVMFLKVRNAGRRDDTPIPFSVYLRFQQPAINRGREVIWVDGREEGKLVAHEPGLRNIMRFRLEPTSFFAMQGSRYPITEVGLVKLVEKLIERGERDRLQGACEVNIRRGVATEGRECTLIEVIHPQRQDHFDFHIARIYIDQELDVPIRYAAYQWPADDGGEPILDEEYVYRDLKLNVGLDDTDFDPDNPDYNYP